MDNTADLKEIVALSEQMLSAAGAYQWDKVQLLEMKERTLITRLRLGIDNPAGEPEKQRLLIQKIVDNHSLISDLATPLQQDIKTLLESFS